MQIIVQICFFLILCTLTSSKSVALSLQTIFNSSKLSDLQAAIKQDQNLSRLQHLCQKEKRQKKIPLSCYALPLSSLNKDSFCLSLRVSHLRLSDIEQALKSPWLPKKCKKHLLQKQKILFYRKKDFLLVELQNYWTDPSSLP